MLLLLVELDRVVVEREHDAVDAHAREARLAHLLDHVAVLALPLLHERRQHQELRALRELHHLVDDLLRRLLRDRPAAAVAGEPAHARPQHAQVVVDLGDGADRRARVGARGLLLDRDRGREALDRVVERLLHLPEELAGVGRQALDVAALALGVERVEGERRLAGARDAGHDHERLLRDRDRDVLEVVLARSGDDDAVGLHGLTSAAAGYGQTPMLDRRRRPVRSSGRGACPSVPASGRWSRSRRCRGRCRRPRPRRRNAARSTRCTSSWAIRSPGGDRERLVAVVDEDDLDLAAVVAVDDAGERVDAVADGEAAARPDEAGVARRDLEAQRRRHGGAAAGRDHDGLARAQVGARGARRAVLGQGAPRADEDGQDERGVVGFGHRDCLVEVRDRTPSAARCAV